MLTFGKMDMGEALGPLFWTRIHKRPAFEDAMDLVRQNSSGKIWLIGGSVFRGLASMLYGARMPEKVDLDFIVERSVPDEQLNLLNKWWRSKNSFGNSKFHHSETGAEVDICPLSQVHSITRRKIEPTIENWMTGTPLNIQSVCFEFHTAKIRGAIGIHAIENLVVAVSDPIQAEVYSKRKGRPIAEIIKEKARELGFSYKLPD